MRCFRVPPLALTIALVVIATSCTATETVTVLASPQPTAFPTSTQEPTAVAAPADETDVVDEPTPAATDPDATTGEGSGVDRQAGDACTYLGVDDFGDMQIELQFTSDLVERSDATIEYMVWDGDRSVLTESTQFLEELSPGEHVRIHVDTVTDPPADDGQVSCTAGELLAFGFAGGDAFEPAAGDSCRFVEVDFANDVQIEVLATNPRDEASQLSVDFAVRSADGVRFADGVAFFDELEPGESATLDVDTFDELPGWVSEDEISCEVLAIEGY